MNEDNDRDAALWAWLEMLRAPNLFTAVADVAMGFLFVQVAAEGQRIWQIQPADAVILALLAAASMLLYAAGVVLNDVADVEVDRQGRPERPIPSGRIALATARRAGWLLLIAGTAIPWIVAWRAGQVRPGLVGTLLAAAIVLYDLGLKRTPLGPLAMGGCRMLNVLLGMSLVAGPLHGEHFLVAGGIGLYIVGVSLAGPERGRSGRPPADLRRHAADDGRHRPAGLSARGAGRAGLNSELVDLLRVESERGVGIW